MLHREFEPELTDLELVADMNTLLGNINYWNWLSTLIRRAAANMTRILDYTILALHHPMAQRARRAAGQRRRLAFHGGRPQFSERRSINDTGESSCESIAD
jgi:hypothetical protein